MSDEVGPDLTFPVTAFFKAVRVALDRGSLTAEKLRIHFIGTSYAPSKLAQATFLSVAAALGLRDIVTEQTDPDSLFHGFALPA